MEKTWKLVYQIKDYKPLVEGTWALRKLSLGSGKARPHNVGGGFTEYGAKVTANDANASRGPNKYTVVSPFGEVFDLRYLLEIGERQITEKKRNGMSVSECSPDTKRTPEK